MLTRFRTNVARYPRLFTVWLVGCLLAITESCALGLASTDAQYAKYANAAGLVFALVFAALIYRWVIKNPLRIAIFLNIADLFEGRDVCTIEAHRIAEEGTFEEDETL